MVIDILSNAHFYSSLHPRLEAVFNYLLATDLTELAPGKYAIDGDSLFAIVQEYDTMDSTEEKMESHKKYIDVQYMISGEEMVGHAMAQGLTVAKEYDAESDFMLYSDAPSFYSKLQAGMFMIFFPTDPHMPCIKQEKPERVKKVVVKVAVG